MFRLYAILIVVGLLGGAVYGAKYYYDTTQNTIASLRENNAKLEVANETNQATIKKMGQDTARLNDLTNQLAQDKLWDDLESITGVDSNATTE